MNQKPPADQKARLAAINPKESIILQAPAGSGKTEVLIQRFLALLALVKTPEEVVALTFTNKAANEMLERVLTELKFATKPEATSQLAPHKASTLKLAKKVLQQDAEHAWGLLDNPNRLQIKTFDSLCLSIVRRAPLLSKNNGIDTPTEDANEIYQAAVNQTLSMLKGDSEYAEALKLILEHLTNDQTSFRELVMDMLAKRDQWLRLGLGTVQNKNLFQIKLILNTSWQQLKEKLVKSLSQAFTAEEINQFIFFAEYSNANLAVKQKRPEEKFDASINETLACFKNWAGFSLTGTGNIRKSVDKRQGFPVADEKQKKIKNNFLEFLQSIRQNQALVRLWQSVINLPEDDFSDSKWQLIAAILKTLKISLANLKLEFNQRGEVDYVEIAQAANQALGQMENPSHLALYLDNKISHILIDEFQDTNHSQFAFLEKLTLGWNKEEGQTLFIVGDPMQSIYGFREADVGLFLKVRTDGINEITLKPLSLKVNFRSNKNIVSWVNNTFNNIFPTNDDYLSGAISFMQSSAFNKDKTGGVKLHGFYCTDTKYENRQLIAIVKAALNKYKGKTAKKVAILVRSRAHLSYISHLLNLEKLPYRALEMNKLTESQTVEDLRSLTRAFLHPADKAAWLAVLRAPWCGLNLAELQFIVDLDSTANMWELILKADTENLLKADRQIRLKKVINSFTAAFNNANSLEPEIVIEKLWYELEADKYSPQPAIQEVQMFIDCLGKAHTSAGIAIDKLDYELDRFYVPENRPQDCQLECMTIHKAKGLEFDTVLVPMLGKGKPGNKPELLRWSERILGTKQTHSLLLAPIKAKVTASDAMYEYLGKISKDKTWYEEMRVLYVATTRAKENLHLFASKKHSDKKAPTNSPLALLEDAFAGSFTEIKEDISNPEDQTYPKLRRRKIVNIKIRKHKPPTFKKTAFKLFSNNNHLIAAGIVFHKVCEHIAKIGVENIDSKIINSFVDKQLKANINEAEELHNIKKLVKTALNNTLTDKTGRWILSAKHIKSLAEWRISRIKDGKVSQSIIDRAFIEGSTLWIVDYKLSQPEQNETKTQFCQRMKKSHNEQLATYKNLAAKIHRGPIKLMLYLPLLPEAYELTV